MAQASGGRELQELYELHGRSASRKELELELELARSCSCSHSCSEPTPFQSNSKALAEGEGKGVSVGMVKVKVMFKFMFKVMLNRDTGKVVVVLVVVVVVLTAHMIGLDVADLIEECGKTVAVGTTVQELSIMAHTHTHTHPIPTQNKAKSWTMSWMKSWTKPSKVLWACRHVGSFERERQRNKYDEQPTEEFYLSLSLYIYRQHIHTLVRAET